MVATCGGAFLGVAPLVGAVGAVVWIVGLPRSSATPRSPRSSRRSSLPIAAVLLGEPWPVIAFAAGAAAAVLVLHRANIARLRAGTENRFQLRRTATSA